MVLQLEDVIDSMIAIFPDPRNPTRCAFDLVFELDHSSGHAKDCPDGLSTVPSILNLGYGGAQRIMRESKLCEGCFGTVNHARRLKVGDMQKMVFGDTDLPLITNKNFPKYDQPIPGCFSKKNLTVAELKQTLEAKGLNANGDRKRLLEQCEAAGIAVKKRLPKMIAGYVGKQKGSLQITFESGFCDEKLCLEGEKVSAHGKEKETFTGKFISKSMTVDKIKKMLDKHNLSSQGNRTQLLQICAEHKLPTTKKVHERERDQSTIVLHFLQNCDNFKNEKGQMQFVLEDKLNVKLRMTPKCHPEIAGQGIEYAWGYAKLRFHQHFINMTAVNLEKNDHASLSSDVVTQARVNKFIWKARD